MIKYVPLNHIEDDESFPYDFKHCNYPTELLRSYLYSAWWTVINDDCTEEYAIVMDYDGFIEWYNTNEPRWAERDGTPVCDRFTAEEYLPYHIGRTIDVVKEV